MPTTHDTPRLEALLAHSDWVRGLVAGLVLDPARAEDALQETWLAALERPPKHDGDLRAWLATVARNAVRRLGRGDARRARREQVAARLEALPDTVDVIAKARMQRRLVDAALALDEPYRTTVLLRFFEDLPPREIAERLGRPVNTVRTHLERGLAKLRGELDAEYGDREAWGFAFLPLCFDRGALATSGSLLAQTGGILMLCKYVLPAAAVVFGLAAWIGGEGASAPVVALEGAEDRELAARGVESAEIESASMEAVDRSPVVAPSADSAVAASAPTHRYAGLLVDVEGRPVPRAELVLTDPNAPRRTERGIAIGGRLVVLDDDEAARLVAEPDLVRERVPEVRDTERFLRLLSGIAVHEEHLSTDDAGRFDVEVGFPWGNLSARGDRVLLLGKGTVSGEADEVYVLAETRTVAGRVLDEDGEPIEGASLAVPMTVERTPNLPFVLRDAESFRSGWTAQSDPNGRFHLAGVPAVAGLRLSCSHSGYERLSRILAEEEPLDVELVLRAVDASRAIAGHVLTADGEPAAHIEVSLGMRRSLSDAEGAFRFQLDPFEIEPVLLAVSPGFAPAIVTDLDQRLEQDPESCRRLELRLGAATDSVAGRVVDGEGRGIGGVAVHVTDGARGALGLPLEFQLAGVRADFVTTDVNGRFELEGMYRPTCRLLFHDLGTGRIKTLEDVALGARNVRVVLGDDLLLAELRGTVVDRRGRPVAGATLASRFTLRDEGDSGGTVTSGRLLGETDQDGRFALRDVPLGEARFAVRGEGIEETSVTLHPNASGELRIEVPLLLRFRLDGDVAPGATRYEVHDEAGEALRLHAIYPDHTAIYTRAPVRRGDHLPTVEVSDAATELVFFTNGEVSGRKPLHLARGEVVVVR